LRVGDAEAAAKARSLLEELVRDRPKNGRAYASLAEACLRLSDARCARDAVTKAVARQPRRAKYRALAGRIERTFASGRE
ncbi:MAG TPA: tetratricopeptide repeat protein, partial [Polyangiales bacterium]